jgi:predicted trehalose synthase
MTRNRKVRAVPPTPIEQAAPEWFPLEKTCYDLRYELDNRPGWIAIRLGGLYELLSLETKDVPR